MPQSLPHDQETIELRASEAHPRAPLWQTLRKVGFKRRNQIWALRRTGEIPNWQSYEYGMADVYSDDQELSYEERDRELGKTVGWNRIILTYPLATVPEEYVNQFADATQSLAQEFGLQMYHKGDEVNAEEIKCRFQVYCQELTEEYGGPGSKTLRMFIELL